MPESIPFWVLVKAPKSRDLHGPFSTQEKAADFQRRTPQFLTVLVQAETTDKAWSLAFPSMRRS